MQVDFSKLGNLSDVPEPQRKLLDQHMQGLRGVITGTVWNEVITPTIAGLIAVEINNLVNEGREKAHDDVVRGRIQAYNTVLRIFVSQVQEYEALKVEQQKAVEEGQMRLPLSPLAENDHDDLLTEGI